MSRRRGEFEHRTSIFEGAYRAWSHLGGCDPEHIFQSSTVPPDLDPLLHPHGTERDMRKSTGKGDEKRNDRTTDFFPYEPLPRSGLAHPYIQAVITPWLGPDADETDILHGLTTLRTWWQHRRKGESNSAKASLGTPTMKTIVDGYTRHFFNLAHCLVVNDSEQPPRTLCEKMKIGQKNNIQVGRRAREKAALENAYNAISRTEETATRTMTAESITNGASSYIATNTPHVDNLGTSHHTVPMVEGTEVSETNSVPNVPTYGDVNTIPIVYRSKGGDVQICVKIKGITCGHCVKMVETALKGISGDSSSPIPGLMDVVCDQNLACAVVRISQVSSAKRISHEIGEVLSMVGYIVEVKEVLLDDIMSRLKAAYGQNHFSTRQIADRLSMRFETIPSPIDIINWETKCTCPDSGVDSSSGCTRHSILNQQILDLFDSRGAEVVNMILEEGSPSHQNSAVAAAGLHMSASSCSLERTSKKQKRTHGMIETSPIYDMNNNGRKEQDQYYNQHGFYPEHHTSYNQDDPSAAGHGSYHRPTGSYTTADGTQNYNANDNTQYPYWQQQQQHNVHSQYYNGAQNMNPQDMNSMQQQQSNYYYQQNNFPPYPMGDFDHNAMNYQNPGNEQQSVGLVSAGTSIGSSYQRNHGWNGNNKNENQDHQRNLDSTGFP